MQNNPNTNIEHIIAKLDNDFNLDTTDYVPRVAAWVIEALSILKCTPREFVSEDCNVVDRIAQFPCELDFKTVTVYDKNGCKIPHISKAKCACVKSPLEQIAIPANPENVAGDYVTTDRYKVIEPKAYYEIDKHKIGLTFNTDKISIRYKKIKTYRSEDFGCDLPVIPNNGLLVEAITNYCMYKILCRGIKHPVFNLSASQYGTNPYYMWRESQDKVKRSVLLDKQGEVIEDNGEWRKAFFNFTFNPKD